MADFKALRAKYDEVRVNIDQIWQYDVSGTVRDKQLTDLARLVQRLSVLYGQLEALESLIVQEPTPIPVQPAPIEGH